MTRCAFVVLVCLTALPAFAHSADVTKVTQCRGVDSGGDYGTRVLFTVRGPKVLVASVDHETVAGPSPAVSYVVKRVAADTLKGDGLTIRLESGAATAAGEVPAQMTIETGAEHVTEELLCLFSARDRR